MHGADAALAALEDAESALGVVVDPGAGLEALAIPSDGDSEERELDAIVRLGQHKRRRFENRSDAHALHARSCRRIGRLEGELEDTHASKKETETSLAVVSWRAPAAGGSSVRAARAMLTEVQATLCNFRFSLRAPAGDSGSLMKAHVAAAALNAQAVDAIQRDAVARAFAKGCSRDVFVDSLPDDIDVAPRNLCVADDARGNLVGHFNSIGMQWDTTKQRIRQLRLMKKKLQGSGEPSDMHAAFKLFCASSFYGRRGLGDCRG